MRKLVVALFALVVTSCHRDTNPTPDDVQDLGTICNSYLADGLSSDDRTRVRAADGWLPSHLGELRSQRARDLATAIAAGDLTRKESLLRTEVARVGLQPCILEATYAALIARSPYARDLGTLCDSQWPRIQQKKVAGDASLESPEARALLDKLAAASTAEARSALGAALDAAGVVPYADDGKTSLDKSHCRLLTESAPDGLAGEIVTDPFAVAAGAPKVSVILGNVTVQGAPSTASAEATLQSNVGRFQNCYTSLDPALAGTKIVRLKVDASGAVVDSDAKGGTLTDTLFSSCIARSVRFLKFEPPRSGAASISLTLTFAPTQGAASTR